MNRGVPGLYMPPAPPAAAHGPGLRAVRMPRQFADAENTWPRPRRPCSSCEGELVLCWGQERKPYARHLTNRSGNCTGGGEGALHLWAKEDLADYLSQENELRFFSRCQKCKANVRLDSVPVKSNERTVKTEHRLSTGGIADIAVCAGNETVVIEVLSTHRTAPVDGESPLGRPEPWYEVEANAVLRMLKYNSSYGDLECVRDRLCPKCESREKRRKTLRQWTLYDGKRKEKTFEEASSDIGYRNKILRKLVEGQFRQMAEQLDPFSPLFPGTIAFEVPKGQYINVSRVFRNDKLKGKSLLTFAEYLVNDPDLYAISATHHSSSAKWEKTPYKPGQVRASGVTVVRFDSRSGNWTNVTTYPRARRAHHY